MKPFFVTEAANGYGNTIEVTKKLYEIQSKFQKIEIYETVKLGRLLLLDGIIQLTSFDEFAYHEMMANLPFYACPEPRRALVIGGGDGGVLRELSKHSELEIIDICEIDNEVIEAAKIYLPETAVGFNDPRVQIHIADGSEFIRNRTNYYDIIIVDSTDPCGPGEPLFGREFYQQLTKTLRYGGVITTQAESPYLLPKIVARLMNISRKLFSYAGYATIMVPTYPTGLIGACVASNDVDVTKPNRKVEPEMETKLRYYNTQLHSAAFVQPLFSRRLWE